MNSHFLKGSKVETLEDVLAGPETEVMDGIQVTQKRWSSDFFPQIFYDFSLQAGIDRYNLRATSSAQRVQKWTLLPTDFSIPGEQKKNSKHAFALSIYPRWWDGPDTEGEAAPGDAEVQGERRQVVRRLAPSWSSWRWSNWWSEENTQWKWQNIRGMNSLQEISQGQDD